MKIVAKKDRKLLLINTGNTQNENKAETIELTVPEEYEDYNKKIVFVTDDGIVWDIIQDNTYKLTKAITKYKQVDFYIWLTKDDVDFRTETRSLRFYHNEDASDEITPEEIHGVNTVVNLLEEEITKVDSLETELRALITDIQNKLDNGEFDGEDGYTPQKGVDYFTEQDIEEIETEVKNDLEENVLVNYSLIAETGAKIELSINTTDYKLKAILKDKNNNIIHTSNVIDLPLETMVVNATYDNLNKAIILTLQNGTTVSTSVADLVSGLVSESQLQTILSNYYTKTEINNLLNNKVDKVQGKELSSNDFTDTLKEKLEGLENYDDTEIKADISDIQNEQTEQNTDIENLQTENARLKATLPTTTGEGQDITLDKTAELEFKKPPLPMGNSEQESTEGKNLFNLGETIKALNNIEITKNGSQLILNGTTIGNEIVCDIDIGTFPAGTYTITKTKVSGTYPDGTSNGVYIRNKLTTSNIVSLENVLNNDSKTFSLNEQTSLMLRVFVNVAGKTFNNLVLNFMLEEGSTATEYEPYTNGASPNPDYPQEITNVTGDVEVKVQNKNLNPYPYKDTTKTENGITFTDNGDGTINVNGTASSTTYFDMTSNGSTKGIKLKAGTYNVSIGASSNVRATIAKYSNASEVVAIIPINTSSTTFTIEEDTEITFVLAINNGLSANNILIKPQIEKGSTATPYTPHKEQTFIFPLGNEKLMLGDYLADDGIHHVRGQVRLDSLTWFYTSDGNRFKCDNISNLNIKGAVSDSSPSTQILSNIFTVYSNNWIGSNNFYDPGIAITTTGLIRVKYIDTTDVNVFETMLTNKNGILEYELAEEIIVPYTSAQQEVYNQIKQALSYEEQTNISGSSNGSNPIFNVEAYQDAKVILAEKYVKPSTGIPKTDLASAVQTSLGKADTALQSHQDISGKANKISVVQTSASTIEINPNTFYKFGEVASLNITLASITDNTIYNEYMFEFVSGTTATTLTLPSSIKWLETPTIDANKIYQCSIVDNVGLLVGVANV